MYQNAAKLHPFYKVWSSLQHLWKQDFLCNYLIGKQLSKG